MGQSGSVLTRTTAAAQPRAAAGIRSRTKLPVVVGFGIRTPEQAARVAKAGVDGIVVGTEIVRTIAEAATREARVEGVRGLVGRLKAAIDGARR